MLSCDVKGSRQGKINVNLCFYERALQKKSALVKQLIYHTERFYLIRIHIYTLEWLKYAFLDPNGVIKSTSMGRGPY